MAVVVHCLFLLVLLNLFSSEAQQIPKCEGGNYSANSAFGSNLNRLLSNLSSSNSIFSTATIGVSSTDRVYGLVLCRGDQDPSSCNTCFKMLSHNVTQLCPYSREATVWDRNCELRYSDRSFFNSLATQDVSEIFCNAQKSTDTTFTNMSTELFEDVSYQAAFNSSRRFATGKISYSGDESSTIYSYAQCTMDLSMDLCSKCLNQTLEAYLNICPVQIGGWFLGKSCNYRYEVLPFYNGNPSLVLTLPSPSSSRSPSPIMNPTQIPSPLVSPPSTGGAARKTSGGKTNTRKVISTVISVAIAVVLVHFTRYFYCVKVIFILNFYI